MKHQIAVFALICATLVVPASAAVDDCVYGGSQLTQANNGDVLTVSSQNHVCVITPVPASSIGGGSNFPTGITVGTSGVFSPNIATWGVTGNGGTTTTAFADSALSAQGIQCSRFGLINNVNAKVLMCVDRSGNIGGSFNGSFFGTAVLGTQGSDNPGALLINSVNGQTKIGTDVTQVCGGIAGDGLAFDGSTGSGIITNAFGLTDVGFCGPIHAQSGVFGAGGGAVAATFHADSTPASASYHCVTTDQLGLTAVGASTAVSLSGGLSEFSGTGYTLTINDNGPTGFTNAAITAKTPTGFTFTSTNFATDTYSYNACGE